MSRTLSAVVAASLLVAPVVASAEAVSDPELVSSPLPPTLGWLGAESVPE